MARPAPALAEAAAQWGDGLDESVIFVARQRAPLRIPARRGAGVLHPEPAPGGLRLLARPPGATASSPPRTATCVALAPHAGSAGGSSTSPPRSWCAARRRGDRRAARRGARRADAATMTAAARRFASRATSAAGDRRRRRGGFVYRHRAGRAAKGRFASRRGRRCDAVRAAPARGPVVKLTRPSPPQGASAASRREPAGCASCCRPRVGRRRHSPVHRGRARDGALANPGRTLGAGLVGLPLP